MKRLLAILLALCMLVAMTGCGDNRSAGDNPPPTTESDTPSDPITATESDDLIIGSENIEAPTLISSINGGSIITARPFSEGVAWVQYYDANATLITALIDTTGTVVFSTDRPVYLLSDFHDGYAFYSYYGEKNSAIHNSDSEYFDVIVDKAGNETYHAGLAPDSNATEENIICYGNGKFVVQRNESGITANKWSIGTIDHEGNTIDAFIEIDEGLAKSRRQGSGLSPIAEYETGKNGSKYIGDDKFYIEHIGNGYMIYDTRNATFENIHGSNYPPVACNDGTYTFTGGTHLYPNGEGGVIKFKPDYGTDFFGVNFIYQNNMSYYRNGVGKDSFVGRGYYDNNLQLVLPITIYPDNDMLCHAFYGDYAIAEIEGADGKRYVTTIDRQGVERFNPIECVGVSEMAEFGDGYFFVETTEGNWSLMNVYGETVCNIADDFEGIGAELRIVNCFSEGYTVFYDDTNWTHFYYPIAQIVEMYQS